MAMTDGYPFIFQMNDRAGHDEVLEYTLDTKGTVPFVIKIRGTGH